MPVLSRILSLTRTYPILKGMLSYATIWPASCFIEQTFKGNKMKDVDYWRVLNFALYGSCVMAPALYGWVRITTILLPQRTLQAAVMKALLEQIVFEPPSMVCFFFVMELMEGGSVETAKREVTEKFLPTFKVKKKMLKCIGVV